MSDDLLARCENVLMAFLTEERLPDSYAKVARDHFLPLLSVLYQRYLADRTPIVLGVNGCQGSGKSTLSGLLVAWFEKALDLPAVTLSIDDFYLSRTERQYLAEKIHPLLQTRGVPGTHNVQDASLILQALTQGETSIAIPRFNKGTDDPFPPSQWITHKAPVALCILEGWCVGSEAQPVSVLNTPVNTLEASEDPDAKWRRFANNALQQEYAALFAKIPHWVMLKAPNFDCVQRWRWQQEQKLSAKLQQQGGDTSAVMSEQEVTRFIQHYQRITEHTFETLPAKADWVFEMDDERRIVSSKSPNVEETQ